MTREPAQDQLVRLLERRAWRPVLKASPEDYPESERGRLERVQRKTAAQRQRYREYQSAGEVALQFQADLDSEPARRTNSDLRKLKLPTQAEVADEFAALVQRLGVEPRRPPSKRHKPHPPHPWHKSKPRDREHAKRELVAEARRGDRAALETLRTAPQKWARDTYEEVRPGARHSKSRMRPD